ncbi:MULTISPECIES: hypothetical protein [Roseomonadaceae]|uniref:Tetratricopeptide repeat protein n=1 Tax=Falsiroseomonas oleicola TaxID=2801474 RepID=A0ABS6H202_9PROT|nr:hypothetical protein [Roseomonas oleicola]MBU8542689.1 hypothetical protein [Roseomonas oleicola]
MSFTAIPAAPAPPSPALGWLLPGMAPAQRFGLAFALAASAALATASFLPPPAAPASGLADSTRPATDRTAASLERAVAANPEDPAPLRRLAAYLRAGHRPHQLAQVLERLHALTGDAPSLREAMQLHSELGDAAAARRALDRLSALGAISQVEALRLATLRLEDGDAAGAFAGLLAALERMPTPEIALRAMRTATRLPDPAMAMRPMGALLAEAAPDLMEALRRVLLSEGRPDLALFLLEGLPAAAQNRPDTALLLAQAESRAGWGGAALARLLALRATEGLPPGGGALLIELALAHDQLEEAFAVAALLPPEAWPAALPAQLREAAADQLELLAQIDPQRLLSRPALAAELALARGDRALARRLAQQALDLPPDSVEGARGLAFVLRELGQDQAAHERLRRAIEAGESGPRNLRLFAELAARPPRRAAALPLLERLRDGGPVAGETWLRLALAEGRTADATRFLAGGGTASATALASTLTLAAQGRQAALAEAAATALRALPALPEGWTTEEVSVTVGLARPLNGNSLAAALNLLAWTTDVAASDRVVLLLAAAPEVTGAAAFLGAGQHPALGSLLRGAAEPNEAGTARLALVSVLAPAQAVALLRARTAEDPDRFGPGLVLALLRGQGVAEGERALRALLPRLPRQGREQALFLVLAAAPQDARPMLRGVAEETLGRNWSLRYEAMLESRGRRAELLAALRARAAQGDEAERQEIALRLTELGDTEGAAAVRRGELEEVP